MILASSNGLMCAVKVIRETPKAWVVQYLGERPKETRIPKASGRQMFNNVDAAEAWIKGGMAP